GITSGAGCGVGEPSERLAPKQAALCSWQLQLLVPEYQGFPKLVFVEIFNRGLLDCCKARIRRPGRHVLQHWVRDMRIELPILILHEGARRRFDVEHLDV